MELPNRLRVEADLPERAGLAADGARDTIKQRWVAAEGRLEGTRASILLDDPEWEDPGPQPFGRRIYSLAELEAILERAGLTLTGVYDAKGAERPPDADQHEIYIVARR